MARLLSRRKVIAGGGVAALTPALAFAPGRANAIGPFTGPLYTLAEPIRLLDSRLASSELRGQRLVSGAGVIATVGVSADNSFLLAAFLNITITQTVGSGYLVVSASDSSGERPLPKTSNINWSSTNQTLANLVLTAVGSENGVAIHCAGGGSTHVIVDAQAYIPFVG